MYDVSGIIFVCLIMCCFSSNSIFFLLNMAVLVRLIIMYQFRNLVLVTVFYLFVGGIMCVLGYFCRFFFSPVSGLIFSPVVIFLVHSWIIIRFYSEVRWSNSLQFGIISVFIILWVVLRISFIFRKNSGRIRIYI